MEDKQEQEKQEICGVEVSKILEFPATQGFGKWKKFFPADSISHPAKCNLNLLSYLVSQYTEEGDVILDPMSGSGSTGVISALNGRNAILIELEEKFCKWINEAKKKVEQQQTLTKKGRIVVIQGDARNIPALMKEHREEISSVLTSPPYAGTSGGKGEKSRKPINEKYPGVFDRCIGGNKGAISEDPKQIDNLKYDGINNIITSPPYAEQNRRDSSKEPYGSKLVGGAKRNITQIKPFSNSEDNIGSLPHIEIDGIDNIITSPPYSESIGKRAGGKMSWCSKGETRRMMTKYSDDLANIGSLPHDGIDNIITSSPYGEAHQSGNLGVADGDRKDLRQYSWLKSDNPKQIDNLKYGINCVISSPPYSNSMNARNPISTWTEEKQRKWWDNYRSQGGGMKFEDFIAYQKSIDYSYSDEPDNIGNLPVGGINTIITSPSPKTLNIYESTNKYGQRMDREGNRVFKEELSKKNKGIHSKKSSRAGVGSDPGEGGKDGDKTWSGNLGGGGDQLPTEELRDNEKKRDSEEPSKEDMGIDEAKSRVHEPQKTAWSCFKNGGDTKRGQRQIQNRYKFFQKFEPEFIIRSWQANNRCPLENEEYGRRCNAEVDRQGKLREDTFCDAVRSQNKERKNEEWNMDTLFYSLQQRDSERHTNAGSEFIRDGKKFGLSPWCDRWRWDNCYTTAFVDCEDKKQEFRFSSLNTAILGGKVVQKREGKLPRSTLVRERCNSNMPSDLRSGDAIPLYSEEIQPVATLAGNNWDNKGISCAIFSPPYGNRFADGGLDDDSERGRMKYSSAGADDLSNIGFLPLIPQNGIGAIITSPPYSSGFQYNPQDREKRIARLIEVEKKNVADGKKWAVSSLEAIERQVDRQDWGYGDESGNIGNFPLSFGGDDNISCVLFSPPYSSSKKGKIDADRWATIMEERDEELDRNWGKDRHTAGRMRGIESMSSGYSDSEDNIGNLGYSGYDGYEIDFVITSPPFGPSPRAGNKDKDKFWDYDEMKCGRKFTKHGSRRILDGMHYSDGDTNVGSLPYVDNIITSPPFIPDPKNLRHKPLQVWDKERGHTPDVSYRGAYGTIEEMSGDNISQIREMGMLDSIITSPPYSIGHDSGNNASGEYSWRLEEQRKHTRAYSPELGNIAKLPFGFGGDSGNIGNEDISCVLFSPPYAKSVSAKNDPERRAERLKEQGYDPKTIVGGKARCGEMDWQYSDQPGGGGENIGGLGYAFVNEIITSPPYSYSLHDTAEKRLGYNNTCDQAKADKGVPVGYSEDSDNIGNLRDFGAYTSISTVLFSPPYEASLEGGSRHTRGGIASRDPKMMQSGTYATTMSFGVPVGYSINGMNIGNLKMSDNEEEEKVDKTIKRIREHGRKDLTAGGPFGKSLGHPYSDEYSEDNIGNLKSDNNDHAGANEGKGKEKVKNNKNGGKNNNRKKDKETYLSAMQKVYAGCFEVLKPNGRLIIVIKDFIRQFSVVKLHDHTKALCESCGFVFDEILAFRLPSKSFWRVIYQQKHGDKVKDLELLNYEFILVFHKPEAEVEK